jgi:hypothetical protein
MTTIESPTSTDQRARWRTDVGLDCPTTAANPRRIRYNGGAELSWRSDDESSTSGR